MISLRNELDIRKCPNEESDLISVRAAITVTIIDGLNHIGCLVLDLILQKKKAILHCSAYCCISWPFLFVLFPCLVCSVHLQHGELGTSGLQVCWLLLV